MNSEELNKAISEICDKAEEIGFEAFGGKTIPYIGWFWRKVDFDKKTYSFGVFPESCDGDDDGPEAVGFMENNKWDYNYVKADEAQWARIKILLETAVRIKTPEALKNVNDAIQGLLKC